MCSIRRNRLALPVLWVGTARNLPFPETGTGVPFEVRTYPFDDDGTETVAYGREFEVGPERRFDSSPARRRSSSDILGRAMSRPRGRLRRAA